MEHILTKFGLSEKEARVYISLLELEVASANEISEKSGVNRSSVYVIIESLRKEGLINLMPGSLKNKTHQKFSAATPENFLQIAKSKRKNKFNIVKKIEEILPELRALHRETRHRPKVTVYEGDEAMKVGFYTIKDNSEFRVYGNPENMMDVVPDNYIEEDSKVRREKNMKMHWIMPDSETSRDIVKKYKSFKSPDQFAIIPKNKYSKHLNGIGISIFQDSIEFASAKEKFLIAISSQEIANTLKNIFDLAWDESKRLNKN